MKSRLLTIAALLVSFCASYAMNETNNTMIKMPKAIVLIERLREIGMHHFVEKTDIVTQLAGKKLEPLCMAFVVEDCLHHYDQHMKTHSPCTAVMAAIFMQKRKPLILEALLEEYPEALTELEDHRLYNPMGEK